MARRPSILDRDWSQHPGFGESLIPVWGSAREAAADWQDGDYVGAVGNGLLAITDVAPLKAAGIVGGKAVIRGVGALKKSGAVAPALHEAGRGVVKLSGSQTWNAVRKDMTKAGVKPAGMHGHHAYIPQSGWGRYVPDAIKNQPANIKVLSPEHHARIHGTYKGTPQFDPVRRIWYGTHDTTKAVGARVGVLTYEGQGRRR